MNILRFRIYEGVEELKINNLVISDLGSGDMPEYERVHAAFLATGAPKDIMINKLHIKSSDRHGVYLTGEDHAIEEIIIDKFGLGNIKNMANMPDVIYQESARELTGVWLSRCNNSLIGSIKVNTLDSKGKLKIFCMNIEALSTNRGIKGATEFLYNHKEDLTIIDESTTIKNHKAIRTRNVLKLADYAKYKRILTGSPVTKSPLDLYTQCDFLDPSHLGFSSYFTVKNLLLSAKNNLNNRLEPLDLRNYIFSAGYYFNYRNVVNFEPSFMLLYFTLDTYTLLFDHSIFRLSNLFCPDCSNSVGLRQYS